MSVTVSGGSYIRDVPDPRLGLCQSQCQVVPTSATFLTLGLACISHSVRWFLHPRGFCPLVALPRRRAQGAGIGAGGGAGGFNSTGGRAATAAGTAAGIARVGVHVVSAVVV